MARLLQLFILDQLTSCLSSPWLKGIVMESAQVHERGSSVSRLAPWGLGALLLIAIVGVVVGVVVQSRNIASLQHRNVDELIAHLQTAGLSVGTPDELSDTLGAERRVQVLIDGRPMELLQFDLSDKAQSARVKQIRRAETLLVDNVPRPAVVNGRFVMVDLSDAAEDDDLVRSFTGFGQPDPTRLAEQYYPAYY
jgi:hypothetical protein